VGGNPSDQRLTELLHRRRHRSLNVTAKTGILPASLLDNITTLDTNATVSGTENVRL